MDSDQEHRMRAALLDIMGERRSQHDKWGEQCHDLPTWLMILGEEVGELNQAVLEAYTGGPRGRIKNIWRETVQVAAVACQIIEYLERMPCEARDKDEPDS
jgi:hypothetical protein